MNTTSKSSDTDEASNQHSMRNQASSRRDDNKNSYKLHNKKNRHVSLKSPPNSPEKSSRENEKINIVTPEKLQTGNKGSCTNTSIEVLTDLVFCLDPYAIFSCTYEDFSLQNNATNYDTVLNAGSFDTHDSYSTYITEFSEKNRDNQNFLKDDQGVANFKIKAKKRLSLLDERPKLKQIEFLKTLAEKLRDENFVPGDSDAKHDERIILEDLINSKLKSLIEQIKN